LFDNTAVKQSDILTLAFAQLPLQIVSGAFFQTRMSQVVKIYNLRRTYSCVRGSFQTWGL